MEKYQDSKRKRTQNNSLKYKKPTMVAKNAPSGGYAAGCPTNNSYQCKTCFRQ